jgi:hypothetical protein
MPITLEPINRLLEIVCTLKYLLRLPDIEHHTETAPERDTCAVSIDFLHRSDDILVVSYARERNIMPNLEGKTTEGKKIAGETFRLLYKEYGD